MKNICKKIKKNWYFGTIVIILLVWAIFNICYEAQKNDILPFFRASLFNIFTIFITSVFAYIFAKHKDSDNRKKQIAESFIEKLLNELDNRMYIIDEQNLGYIRIIQKRVFGHMSFLEKILGTLNMNEEVESVKYIKERFQDYWDFISEHINNLEYLTASRNTLENKILLINNKLEGILTSLYIN